MFKFLKDKLSKAVSIFSKKVDEDEGVKKEEAAVLEPIIPSKSQITEAQIQEEPLSDDDYESDDELVAEDAKEEEERKAAEAHAAREAEKKKQDEEKLRHDKIKRAEEHARLLNLENAKKDGERKEHEHRLKLTEEAKRTEEHARVEHQKRIEEEKRREEHRILEEKRREHARREEERLLAEKRKEEAEKKEKEKKQGGFFKNLFRKKEEAPVSHIKETPKLVLEKEDFEKVHDDYSVTPDEPEEKVPVHERQEKLVIEEEEPKGFFGKIKESLTTIKLSDEKFDELFWDLEVGMLENNVAVEVIEKIKDDLREELTTGKVSRKSVDQIVHDTLQRSIEDLFKGESPDIIKIIKSKHDKPFVIAFIGVNGSGKTTTMAKVAHLLMKNHLSVVFAASDTFRAAAIQQLQEHADKLGVKMIRHDYESDPAAVAFDAIKHAKAKGVDVVMIDTAGRLHTNDNLMNELKKLIRVNNPDMKIFIGEAITGNDCVEQAKLFNEAVGIDGIILAKADIDEKGGAALSVSYVTGKPILFMGTGQTYDDLVKFDSKLVLENIGL